MPRLTIIIATFNSARDIAACLASVPSGASRTPYELVVVDNASTDDTLGVVATASPEARRIELAENRGFSAANNVGIRATHGELVLLLNPDTVVHPAAIDRLVDALDRRGDVAVCGPRLVDADGRAELSFGRRLGPFAELRQKLLVTGHARRWPIITAFVEWVSRRAAEPDWVSGACLLVRRRDAEAVELLDERYFLYAEDVDFCLAVRRRGRGVLFVPEAEVTHLRGRSRRSAASASDQAYRRSHLSYYAKHRPGWAWLLGAYLRLRGRHPG
jgi:GT2 family glycosyltransferase